MKNVTLIIDAIRIPLAESVDVDGLKHRLVAAARSGGDFVPLESERGVQYDFLITAASTVIVQSVTNVFDFEPETPTWRAAMDLEL